VSGAVELEARITSYLSLGGLFNPEMANHDAVRDLLIDCRAELATLRSDNERLGRELANVLHTRRWNTQRAADGVLEVCRGEHDGDECEWERFVPEASLVAAEAERDTLLAQVEKLTGEIKNLRRGNGDE